MSDDHFGDRRQPRRGPINGKIGWFLSALDQMKTFIGIVTIVALALGFKWSTPGEEMVKIREELTSLREEVSHTRAEITQLRASTAALVRISCDKTPSREARLARLDCSGIQ